MDKSSSDITAIESILQVGWHIPLWIIILLALAAGILSSWFYLTERGAASRPARLCLAAIRFTLLMSILWMLMGWSWLRFESDPPELIVVLDSSASMGTGDVESAEQSVPKTRFTRATEVFKSLSRHERQQLLDNYELQWYSLAEQLEPLAVDLEQDQELLGGLSPEGNQSRLGDGLSRLIQRQRGKGTAAIVFFSDGINTAGTSLDDVAQAARRAAIPLHTVALGRQFELPDLRLSDLLMDRQVYLGDQVTLEFSLIVNEIPATETILTLRDATTEKILDERRVGLAAGMRQSSARLSFVPDRAGDIPLRLEASPIEGETELSNNRIDTVLSVRDKSIRVLLVSDLPSYEFRFLKSFLERATSVGPSNAASFQLDSVLQVADPIYVTQDRSAVRLVSSQAETLAEYDVFVFAEFEPQLVSHSAQLAIQQAVTRGGSGCIFIWGRGSPASQLSGWPLEKLLPVKSAPAASELTTQDLGGLAWQPTPLGSTALPMQLARSVQQSLAVWQKLPEFATLARIEQVNEGAQVLAVAADDGNRTQPLLITQFAGAGRVALQATDETYRWTSFGGSDVYYQRYWGQMLRWLSRGRLSAGGENTELLIDPKQSRYGQPIRVQVALGSKAAGRMQADEIVEVAVQQTGSVDKTVRLVPVDQAAHVYQASMSGLKPGNYRAQLVRPAGEAPASEDFTVTAPPGEQASLRANVDGLRDLAERSRGRFYTSADAEQLFDELPPGKPTRLGPLPSIPLWNSWLVALFFVALITGEWILRRRHHML